jgi:hypothetical protein
MASSMIPPSGQCPGGGWRRGAALALGGSAIAVLGVVVISYQVQGVFHEPTICYGSVPGYCVDGGWNYQPAVPGWILGLWAALGLVPLLTLWARRGFRLAAIGSLVLAAFSADWAFWVEQDLSGTNPVLLFQGTLAVCVGACLGVAGYWTLRQHHRLPANGTREGPAGDSARSSELEEGSARSRPDGEECGGGRIAGQRVREGISRNSSARGIPRWTASSAGGGERGFR